MFQNAFQSGSHLEIFDAKVSKEKDKNYEKLFKLFNPNGITKVFDKTTKGYIYELDDAMKTKIQFPKNEKQELGLVQHYLVFQIFIPVGTPFSLEVVVTDTTKNKRRLNFTSSVKSIDKTYFHAKIPVDLIKRGVWLNLSIDLISFFDLFKGQTFRSIDSFVLGAVCKLRRIFTMKNPLAEFSSDDEFSNQLPDSQQVPKNQNFLPGVTYYNQILTLDGVRRHCGQTIDIKESISDEESFSKNSTGISQALKVRGLLSATKEPKNSTSYSTSTANNTRIHGKVEERRGIKTQQVHPKGNSSISFEQNKRAGTSKNKDDFENPLQVRGIKRNNLLANYDLENASGGEEHVLESYESPEKFEESDSLQILSPKPMNLAEKGHQRRTASIGPKTRDLNSKKRSPQPANITEEDEEEKVSSNHKIKGKIKSKLDERVSRLQKDREDKKNQKHLGSTQQGPENKVDKSPFSRRVASATSKFMINEKKEKASAGNNNNPWGQNPANKDSKLIQQNASPKGLFTSPRLTANLNKAENKRTTPLTSSTQPQSHKHPSPLKNRPAGKETTATKSSGQKEGLTKTPASGSTERFNTTGKFSNRYDLNNKDYDLIDQANLRDEIESIEENLEYEITSNTSGMNGSKGFSDYKQRNQNLIDLAEGNFDPKVNSNKKGTTNASSGKRDTYKFRTPTQAKNNKGGKDAENEQQQGIIHNVYNITKHNLEDYEDSLENTPNGKDTHHGNGYGLKQQNNEEEKRKINAIENQVNNMVANLRPYSPPYSFGVQGGGISNNPRSTVITKKNDEVVVLGKGAQEEEKENKDSKGNEMMEVVYDPVWNCYYHPKSNTYYEMKE